MQIYSYFLFLKLFVYSCNLEYWQCKIIPTLRYMDLNIKDHMQIILCIFIFQA